MNPPFPPDDEDESGRDVAALRLREDLRFPGARHDLADALGGLVARIIARIEDATHDDGMPPIIPPDTKPILASATATFVQALEGTAKSKALDGALKAAQIEQAYADAHDKRASAALKEAQAAEIRFEMRQKERDAAIQELTQVLELIRTFGVSTDVCRPPNGVATLTLLEGLLGKVPLPPHVTLTTMGELVESLVQPKSEEASSPTSAESTESGDAGS